MKKVLLLAVSIITILCTQAKDITAYFSFATFNTAENKPFVETYLTVVGNTINYQLNENNKYQGNVSISLIFKKNDTIIDFKKINLLSPEFTDTINGLTNFIDQQRFALPNDNYLLQIEIKDNYSNKEAYVVYQPININYISYSPSFSDIQFVEKYELSTNESIITKSGYDLIPYVSNFYPENMNSIKFYAEIYNVDKKITENEPYLINYYIENYETESIVGNNKRFLRKNASSADAIIGEFDITNLPSGNYNLVVDARNKQNEQISRKSVFFQRSNPSMRLTKETFDNISLENSFVKYYTNIDTLSEFVQCLYPIASEMERNFIRENNKSNDVEFLQKFFLSFWQDRNRLNPELAWSNYENQVRYVQKEYGSVLRSGYQTDRGRIYLKYGKPTTINKQYNEPNSYPYEIWHYYHENVKNRNNVKFVFYAHEQATNEFELLHSTAYGERKDYKWQTRLQKRTSKDTSVDQNAPDDNYGSRADDYFNLPR